MTDRNIKVGVEVDASDAKKGMQDLGVAAQDMSRKVKKAGEEAGQGLGGIGEGSEKASEKIDRTSKSIIQSIQRTTVALESGGRTTAKYYETIANQRGVSVDALRPYLEQLKAVESAQGKFTQSSGAAVNSLNNVGISAKQTAAAMRNVPAQFTDIVTSLQGGQAPLTVLLQQGGQLKDMFGGIGNAAGALGKYMLGLINPFTLLAGAAVAVAVGYAKGSQEASDFAKSIIMTGNAAGATANQLIQITEKLNAADAGSKRLIAESLNTLISSGKLSSGVLEEATLAAVGAQKILGIAVADTAKEYANLAKAPSEVILNLASNYKGLTVEVYKQVKALEDQGKASEAAILAQSSYAKVLTDQKDAVENTLGRWERGWNRLKDAAAGVVDSILDIGRVSSNVEQLTPLLAERRNLNSQRSKLGTSEDDNFNRGVIDSQLLGINARIKALVAEEKALILSAAAEDTANKKRLAGIEVEKMLVDSLTKTEQKKIAIAKAEAQFEIAGTKENDRKKILATIEKKYAESLTEQESAYKSLSKAISEKVGLSQIELNNEKPLTESERLRVKMLELLSDAQTKKQKQAILSLGTNIDIIKSNEITKQSYERLRKEIENYKPKITSATDIIEGIAKQDKAYSDLITTQEEYRMSLNDNADLMQLEASLMGQSATDRNTAIEQYKIEIALKKELLKIEQDINLTQAQKDERSDVARENANIAKSQASLKVQQGEWSKFYTDIYNGLTDSLYRGFESGKGFFQSFWDSIKNLFKTTVLKLAVQAVVTSVLGSGISGIANAQGLGSQGSGISSLSSIYSMGKSLWDGFSAAGTVGGGVVTLGNALGSSTVSAFGSGMSLSSSQAASAAAAYNGAGMTGTGTAISAGQSVGAALPIVGWVLAGMAANNSLYDKGWGGKATDETKQLGIASGMVGGALKETIQKWFGLSDKSASMFSGSAVVNRLFGYKAAEIQQSELSGSFGDGGYSGSTRDVYKQKGGVFRGDKWSETINKQDASAMTEAFTSIKEAAKGYANILGLSTDALNTFTKDFKVNLSITGDAAKDAEANQKILTDILTGVTNDLSNLLAPALSGFAKEGESASATLQRLATGLSDVNFIMRSVGFDEFAKSLEGSSAATRLSELTGGIEKLASGAQYFFENFLTDAEKIKPSADLVTDTMKRLGQSSVDTIEEFKSLVQGLDLASESGAKMYAELIAIAPQFKAVADYTSELTGALTEFESAAKAAADAAKLESDILSQRVSLQNEYNQLTMTSTELLALQRNEIYESNRALFDSISAVKQKREAEISAAEANKALTQTMIKNAELAQQILINAVDAERKVSQSVLESTLAILDSRKSASATVFDTQKAILGASLSAAKSLASTLYSEANRIDGIAKSMVLADNPNNIGGSVFAAQAKLRSGDTSAETIKLATSSTQDMFASWADYAQNFFETKSLLQSSAAKAYSVAGEAMSQADAISAQLVAAEESYKSDLTHYAEQEKIARETMSQQTAYFDKIVSIATLALQEAQGTKIAVLSLPAAILNANANIQALASRTERPAQLIPSEPPANDLLLTEIRDLLVEQGRSSERLTTIMNDATNGGTIIRTVSA